MSDLAGQTGGFPVPGTSISGAFLPSGLCASSNVELYLDFYCDPGRDYYNATLASTLTITISPNGASGNSPNSLLVVAQNTVHNTQSGIVSIINSALSSNNLSPYVGATASSNFSPLETLFPTQSTYFNGVRISLLDDYITSAKGTLPSGFVEGSYLVKILIRDNRTSWTFQYPGIGTIPAPNYPYSAVQHLGISNPWGAVQPNEITNPLLPFFGTPYRGFFIG
jgi:hypothetical protein